MPQVNKIPPADIFNFTLTYLQNAVRRGGVHSRQEADQLKAQEFKLTPQDLGNFANRINIRYQLSKSQHQRFIDTFA